MTQFHGQVLKDGQFVVGAVVQIRNTLDGSVPVTLESKSKGLFDIDVPSGIYDIEFSGSGMFPDDTIKDVEIFRASDDVLRFNIDTGQIDMVEQDRVDINLPPVTLGGWSQNGAKLFSPPTQPTLELDPTNKIIRLGADPLLSYSGGTMGGTGVWMGLDSGVYKFFVGNSSADSMEWTGTELIITGDLTATVGNIGGFVIGEFGITSTDIGIYSAGYSEGAEILLGHATDYASAAIGLKQDGSGKLASGNITWATDGTATFNDDVYIGPTSSRIYIDGVGKTIGSEDFVSGSAGFQIDGSGDAEFNNIVARGNIATQSLIFQEAAATRGTILITYSAGELFASTTATGTTFTVQVTKTPSTNAVAPFASGDACKIDTGLSQTWFTVGAGSDNGGAWDYWEYTATYQSGSSTATYLDGSAVADYGLSGQGGITLTADQTDAPYMDVFTHSGSPWSGVTTYVRVGNLNGFLGESSDKYGFAAGETDKFLKYNPTDGLIVRGDITADTGFIGGPTGWVISTDTIVGGGTADEWTGIQSGAGTTKVFFAGAPLSDGVDALAYIQADGFAAFLNLEISNFAKADAFIWRNITILSTNDYESTGGGPYFLDALCSDGKNYTFIDLSASSTPGQFIRIAVKPNYPIGGIILPLLADLNTQDSNSTITIENAITPQNPPVVTDVNFSKPNGTFTGSPSVDNAWRIGFDSDDWIEDLFESKFGYNKIYSANFGARYMFTKSKFDWRVIATTSFDKMKLTEGHVTGDFWIDGTLHYGGLDGGPIDGTIDLSNVTTTPTAAWKVFYGNATGLGSWITTFAFDGANLGIGISNPSSRIHLPRENDAATPTIAFGTTGNTGFYERAEDDMGVSINAGLVWVFSVSTFGSIGTGRPRLLNEVASATNPNITPNAAESGTGIGSFGTNTLSLIANSVEAIRMTTTLTRIFGDLQVDGTTTTLNSTTLTVDDPIITLGGDTAPGSDDNKDRGVEWRWFDGIIAARVGFMGWDDSAQQYIFAHDVTNVSEVFTINAYSDIRAARLGLGVDPAFEFHIAGNVASAVMIEGTSSGRVMVKDSGATAGKQVYDMVSEEDKLRFRLLNDSGTGEALVIMTMLSDGNIGIGDTNPLSDLVLRRTSNPAFTIVETNNHNITISLEGTGATEHTLFTTDSQAGFSFAGGNVGIGTITPGEALEVAGSISVQSNINQTNYTSNQLDINPYQNLRIFRNTNNGNADFVVYSPDGTGGTVNFMIDGGSNFVGIGSTPVVSLHVESTGGPTVGVFRDNATINGHILGHYSFYGTVSGATNKDRKGAQITGQSTGSWATDNANYAPTELKFYTQDASTTDTIAAGPRMTINEDGWVGVNVDPTSLLHLDDGSNQSIKFFSNSSVPLIILESDDASPLAITIGKILSTNNATNYRYTHIGDGSTSNYVGIGFWGNDDILNVQATGDVGIGEINPGSFSSQGSALRTLMIGGLQRPQLLLNSTTGTQEARIVADGAGFFIDNVGAATAANNKIIFRTSNIVSNFAPVNRIEITSDGKFGIGITPTTTLHVSKSGGVDVKIDAVTNGSIPRLIFADNVERGKIWYDNVFDTSFNPIIHSHTQGADSGFVWVIGGDTKTSEQMRLTTSGFIFNDQSRDLDFRVESANNENTLFVDGGADRVGIGTATPDVGLDVEAVLGNTNSKLGATYAIYTISNSPSVGFNAYYNTAWKFGAGSVTKYASQIGFDPTTGALSFQISDAQGSADATATMVTNFQINQDGTIAFPTSLTSGRVVFAGASGILDDSANFLWNDGTNTFTVTGDLIATTKSFLIPHPMDINRNLHYGSLEGPEHAVYHRGRLTDTDVILLPYYWEKLVRDESITVQLTPASKSQRLFVRKIENNKIYVGKGMLSGEIDCYYIVHGMRKDVPILQTEVLRAAA